MNENAIKIFLKTSFAFLMMAALAAPYSIVRSPTSLVGLGLQKNEARAAVSVVADSNTVNATMFEGQRKVFRNPRGTQNFYAFAAINTAGTTHVLRVFRSTDGVTWAQEGTDLMSAATAADQPIASFTIREDATNSQLIIYLVYSNKDSGTVTGYRRGTIADAATAITWSAEFDISGNRGDPVSVPVIFELNNNFLCIVSKDRGITTNRGFLLQCSTVTDPLADAASWDLFAADPFDSGVPAAANANIGFTSGTKMPAGSTNNGVAIFVIDATNRCGRPFSWNGAAITLGTQQCFTVAGNTDALEISMVPDTAANIVHVLTEDGTLLKSFKWTVTGAFPAATTVKDAGVGNSFSSLGLSVDTSVTPQKLHAFFVQSNTNTSVLLRKSNADTIAWDTADTTVVSGEASAADRLSISHQNQVSSIHLLYTLQGAAEALRYHEHSLAVAVANITVSGRLYSDEGSTPITTGKIVTVAVATATPGLFSTTADAAGKWSVGQMAQSQLGLGRPITAWVDNDVTTRAVRVTKASSTTANLENLDLYQHRVILKHEATSATSTTISDMSLFDNDNDPDIQFKANGGALSVFPGMELHVATGTEFKPGGAITLFGSASTSIHEGTLHLSTLNGTSSILTLEANALTLAGSWMASSTSIFTGSGTVTFNSTSTQTKLVVPATTNANFAALTFNGVGGSWTFGTNPATTTGAFTITAGTATAPGSGNTLYVGGAYSNSGTFTHNSGKVVFNGGAAQTLGATMIGTSAFNHVDFTGAGTKSFGTASASTTNFTIAAGAGAVTAPSTFLESSGDFSNSGTFTHNAGTVLLTGTANTLVPGGTTFNNLTIDPLTAGTITQATNNLTAAGTLHMATGDTFSIGSGLNATSSATLVLNGTISGAGLLAYQSAAAFPTSGTISSILRFDATNNNQIVSARTYGGRVEIYNNGATSRTVTLGTAGAQTVTFSGAGGLHALAAAAGSITLDGATWNPTLSISSATGDLDFTGGGAGSEIIWTGTGGWTVSGSADFTGGTFTASSTNTFVMNGTAKVLTTAANTFAGNLTLSGTITLADAVSVAGNAVVSGTVGPQSQPLTLTGTTKTLEGGAGSLGALRVDGSYTLQTADLTVGTTTLPLLGTLTVGAGRVLTSTSTLTFSGGTLDGTGTTSIQHANLTTAGTLNSNVRFDATAADLTLPARTYGANVEFLSNSAAAARTITLGAGTHTISGALLGNAANTQNVTLAGNTNNPTVTVTGSVDFIGAGAGTEIVTAGTGAWDINGSLDISAGTFTAPRASFTIARDYSNTGGTFTHNNGTTTFDGTVTQTLSGTMGGGSAFHHVEFSGAGAKTFAAIASTTNFVINTGSGTVTVATTTLSGYYLNNATFTHGFATLYIASTTAAQTLSGTMTSPSAFFGLTILNNAGTDAQTSPGVAFTSPVSASSTFTAITASSRIRFPASATSTLQNIVLNGQAVGTRLTLRSSVASTTWGLDVPGTRSVSNANVADSNACSGKTNAENVNIDASDGTNRDAGGNTCWDFVAPTPDLQQLHYRWRQDTVNENANDGWLAAQDTQADAQRTAAVRLRLEISNEGTAAAAQQRFRLEYGLRATTCGAITAWSPVGDSGSTTPAWALVSSPFLPNNASTTNFAGSLTDENGTFTSGQGKTIDNQMVGITLTGNPTTGNFTELEYAIQSSAAVSANDVYCFRVTNAGSSANFTFTVFPQVTITVPTVGGGGAGTAGADATPAVTPSGGGTGQGSGGGGESGGTPPAPPPPPPGGGQGGGGGGESGFAPPPSSSALAAVGTASLPGIALTIFGVLGLGYLIWPRKNE